MEMTRNMKNIYKNPQSIDIFSHKIKRKMNSCNTISEYNLHLFPTKELLDTFSCY